VTGVAAPEPLAVAATGSRHPLVGPAVFVPPAAADVAGVHHASVARHTDPTRSAGGGAARRRADAATAAVAEALERWAASSAAVPLRRASAVAPAHRIRLDEWSLHDAAQRASTGFPYGEAYPYDEWLAQVFDLATNEPCWVPAALVRLSADFGALSTSSGLAADPSVITALLRATQELVERDAYVTTWLHQLGGREVVAPHLQRDVAPLGGRLRAFDLTQDFSPHPVAAVTGTVPLGGAPRHSLGLACRATWDEAVEKAHLEMLQGTVFAGHHLAGHPGLRGMSPAQVTGFDEHAVYYTANPWAWEEIPLHRAAGPAQRPPDAVSTVGGTGSDAAAQLHELTTALRDAGVRLLYRELTTVDCNQVGLRVVRVLSPHLAPLHHDHRWPFLGGRTADVRSRYRDASRRAAGPFPSPYPHALG
jgi:ribosomal protein S12 methylthiotransferase accessory factor